jgi:hypothetical protein
MTTKLGSVLTLVSSLTVAGGLALVAAASAAPVTATSAPQARDVPRFGHVWVIIGENTTYSHLTMANAPFLLGTVRPEAAWLTNYYGATHWSEANYVALTSGQFTSCEQHDGGASCHQNVNNLFHQLDGANVSWKTWLEAGTAKCDTSSGGSCTSDSACPLTGFYTTGNPAILYDDIEGANGVWSATRRSAECRANDVPAGNHSSGMATFNKDLASAAMPRFSLVIPNGCDDGESNCKPINNRYTQFDDFLANEVPRIEASASYASNGVIVIVYDEDERAGGLAAKNGLGSGGHVVCAILSPLVRPGSYGDRYFHYSLLRTLEEGFGLSGYLGSANAVPAITTIWTS